MVVIITVDAPADDRPPEGTPLRLELRDTSLQDAPSRTLRSVETTVRGRHGSWLETVEIEVEPSDDLTVWALADVDGDGEVGLGDYTTQASFPVPNAAESRVRVMLRRV